MIRAFFLSIGQLFDPPILRVLAVSLALTLALFLGFGVALVNAAAWVAARYHWGADGGFAAGLAAALVALAAAILLFRAVAIPVVGLFSDRIVAAVEARHYPSALSTVRDVPWTLSARMAIGSLGRAVLINLIALPGYIFLLFTVIGPAILFLVVNALLLGRDLSDMVVIRHLDRAGLERWRTDHRGEQFALGLIAATLFVIPLINLLAPVISAAMATHLFHQRKSA